MRATTLKATLERSNPGGAAHRLCVAAPDRGAGEPKKSTAEESLDRKAQTMKLAEKAPTANQRGRLSDVWVEFMLVLACALTLTWIGIMIWIALDVLAGT